jgi:hypothetical protein
MINRLPLEFRLPKAPRTAAHETADQSRLRSAGKATVQKAARCIRSYPVASLASAFLSGLIIGIWVKGK